MKKVITILLLFLGQISKRLNIKSRNRFGRIIGRILCFLSNSRRYITLTNIQNAFPEKIASWHQKVMTEAYENLGITLVELLSLKYFSETDMREYVKYKNIELLIEVFSRGKGLILLSGHFGNWEFLAYTAGQFSKIPITVIVKPQKNNYADAVLNNYRTLGGNSIVPMNNAAKTLITEIRLHHAIALLADQSATMDKDIFVDFFGRPAATFEAPAKIALKFDVPIIMGFAVRQPDSTYEVEIVEIVHDDLTDDREGVLELTKRHVALLEKAIRLNPELWSWQHRRWKHTPKAD